jgi:DNA-binding GntR family transcriptional regulator
MYHRLVTAEALDEHEALLDAFRRGDPQLARAAMLVHIQNSRTRLLPAFA